MPVYAIEEFINSKESWILKHIKRTGQQAVNRDGFSLNYGDTISFLNTPYIITPADENDSRFRSYKTGMFGYNNELYLRPGLTPEKIKKACIETYRTTADTLLIPRTMELAKKIPVSPNNIKINSAKSRWGSCSFDKNITFSWRLLMADENTVDYVIFHELAHLIEMNHSDRFWAIVERYVPDYKLRKKQLKTLQAKLSNENWD